jgi:predicted transcriptional regulator
MTSSYRSRMDIIAQILDATKDSASTRTKIMYKTFLSYAQVKEYLDMLVKKDLLEYDKQNQLYKTTEKGNKFLRGYEKIGNYMSTNNEQYAYADHHLK